MFDTEIPRTSFAMERLRTLRAITSAPLNRPKRSDRMEKHPPISEYFGELTFGLGNMREKLPRDAYQDLLRTLDHGTRMSPSTAEAVAQVVKDWAVSRGATHFCHWFQPMTGLTAEKHDAFISIQHSHHSELKVIERFTGSQLVQGEPDASSFPSGGMRSTFEARGYTAWDPTSPLFLIEGDNGSTLCIPTVFFGYHGQALDLKTPLLRSTHAISREACEFLKLLGDVDVKSVAATLGPEQEYFLIDRRLAALRPDLIMTGRTLLGAPAARGQRLEDHYFGSIPSRAKAFMEDLEQELYRLGIPVRTRHNEVAPAQFELAPIFENVNIASDHNTLTMDVMRRVARRHNFLCLLHEKPFAEINGNGKHCNWSIANDKGENLLEPGKTPHQNLRFLAMVAVVIKAVHERSDVLRASIASPGNDHRLGGNEAPPAIISVFLGSLLEKIFEAIEKGEAAQATETQIINLGVNQIPAIAKDYTDRNRTSPFAFTGNKFEFRAVGGSANVAVPLTVVNAAVADAFRQSTARLKALLGEGGANRDKAVMAFIRETVQKHKAILFSGNNYSEEWKAEAKKRGLPILSSTPEALDVYTKESSVAFLVEQGVLSKEELAARHAVAVERYVKTVEIELTTLCEMVREYVVPAVERQILQTAQIGSAGAPHDRRLADLKAVYLEILTQLEALAGHLKETGDIHEETARMRALATKALPAGQKLRAAADKAELAVADDLWPLPKYREMLFANIIT